LPLANLDIPKPGLSPFGHDPEGHQAPLRSGVRTLGHGLGKGPAVTDEVVGRKHEQDRILVLAQGQERAQGSGRGRVPPDRLKDDGLGLHADLPQLLGHHEAVLLVADDDGRRGVPDRAQAHDRLLEHGPLTAQRQELLRVELPGQWPQPGS
jgi:hypothetical protein